MKLKTTGFVVLGLALLAGIFVWAWMPRPQAVDTAELRTGRFERSVQAVGRTRLLARYVVSAPLGGELSRLQLQEGDRVTQGSVVAQLRPSAPSLLDARSSAEQQERVGAMQARLDAERANVERAQLALRQARADLQRSQSLAQQGFVSPTQSEAAALHLQLRDKDLQAASLNAHAVQHELTQLQVALRSGGTQGAAPWLIRAPIDGQVLKVHRSSAGVVAPGTPLIDLGDPHHLEVVVDLLTDDAAQVTPGAGAMLTQWGGPQALKARVRRIEPGAFTKVSALGVEEQRVNVVLDISSPHSEWTALGDGFKTDISIVVQTLERARLVPVSAIFPTASGTALFLARDGRAEQVTVQVLGRNAQDAAIATDLPDGSPVIVYPPPGLTHGSRVQRRP